MDKTKLLSSWCFKSLCFIGFQESRDFPNAQQQLQKFWPHFICSLMKSFALEAPFFPSSHVASGARSSPPNTLCTPLFQEFLTFVWVGSCEKIRYFQDNIFKLSDLIMKWTGDWKLICSVIFTFKNENCEKCVQQKVVFTRWFWTPRK